MARSARELLRSATSSAARSAYCPDAGDIVHIDFDPQAGREHAGKHYALVLSRRIYNEKSRLCVLCPMTSKAKGYPFEVSVPGGIKRAGGVVLADQIKSMSWEQRDCEFDCKATKELMAEVLAKVRALISY